MLSLFSNSLDHRTSSFQQPTKRKLKCKRTGDGSRNQIDKIMISKKSRKALLSAKTYPGADRNSGYVLAAAKFKLK